MPETSPSHCNGESGMLQAVPAPFLYAGIAFVFSFLVLNHQSVNLRKQQQQEFVTDLKQLGLFQHKKLFEILKCTSATECASLIKRSPDNNVETDYAKLLETGVLEKLSIPEANAVVDTLLLLRHDLILRDWLKRLDLLEYHSSLVSFGIRSIYVLKEIQISDANSVHSIVKRDDQRKTWTEALEALEKSDVDRVVEAHWNNVLHSHKTPWGVVFCIFSSVVVAVLVGMTSTMSHPNFFLDHTAAKKLGFLSYVTGKYLSPRNCKVDFNWSDPQHVGNTMTFVVRFFQRNGKPFPISNKDNLLIEISEGLHKVACSVELGGAESSDANKAQVQFTVRRSGEYSIAILIGTVHIRGSPFMKSFLPGIPDPQKSSFVHHCSTVVCTEGISYHLFIEPRDKYNNVCSLGVEFDPSDAFTVDILENSSQRPIPNSFHWECHSSLSRIALVLKLEKEGCYKAIVSYRGIQLKNGDFHIIVLNRADAALVQKNVAKKSHNTWYEAKLLLMNGEVLPKPRKVYIYISPKQLTMKEYVLKLIPKRLITFRLCPSTKFHFKISNNQHHDPILVVDDGCQPRIEIASADRNVIAATFTKFLLKNIGGSETFKDKQEFFYHEVRKLHQKHFHDKLPIKIQREKLLETSMKATKNFSTTDWCKNFEITFLGEQGLDWGGLRREWFELLCCELFDPTRNQLFQRFKNDKQGLVHPNDKRPSSLKLKMYEFAGRIVGKCLYESALGSSYRQLVNARFSRSFLAQLIGLRVHYKYFEQDDPELYVSKIKYILENDVTDMDMVFTEEEYGEDGQLKNLVDLVAGGSNIAVTNHNKLYYLDALAQHRLASNVKDEVESFLKGLNELIPDNFLCIFDENELELLMCGTGQYSIADFKANHTVSGASYEFKKILDWFWTAVSNFHEEEMARLLQFTTGCSQLPPGGFAELNPRFHITSTPAFGNLPTAHTCFNQLCLPDYDSYEQFDRALRLAINEGSEGFGMI